MPKKSKETKKTEPTVDVAQDLKEIAGEDVQVSAEFTKSEQSEKVNSAAEDPAPKAEQPLPKHLEEEAAAVKELFDAVMKKIEDFKSGQAYLEGDVPVNLPLRTGPGINPGDRKFNFIDELHLDQRYAYRWANKKMVDYHRGRGRWTVDHKDFTVMTRARGGQYHFAPSPEGHVMCGDLVLMATTRERDEYLKHRIREKTRTAEGRARGNLRSVGETLGVEVTEDSDALGPKAARLLKLIEQELGPDARRIFLGATR